MVRSLRALGALSAAAVMVLPWALGTGSAGAAALGVPTGPLSQSPIKHVVVIFQENHSFNDLLGKLCVHEGNRCSGTTTGVISDGTRIPLSTEGDLPPSVGHDHDSEVAAIAGGRMDGWNHVGQCSKRKHYRCLEQVHAGTVPTLWALADTYAMSDRTFQTDAANSWGSHLDLVAATLDGFYGNGTYGPSFGGHVQDGCRAPIDTLWNPPGGGSPIPVPACVPDKDGHGPYRQSPVPYVPTIMDSLDVARLPWTLYAPTGNRGGYGWSICPTFWECLSTDQASHWVGPDRFATDAAAGALPAVSFLIPTYGLSQHNGMSLMKGDNWIAKNVRAVMDGPEWASTAIFITYDDCGCFYDPVAPPAGMGVRVPMLIVSPFAKARFVDHGTASFASMLAFIEGVFGLPALPGGGDGGAYDYADAFDFAQQPLHAIRLTAHRLPPASIAYLRTHPPDPDDPT